MKNILNTKYSSTQSQRYMIIFALLSLIVSQFVFAADKDPKIAWDKIDAGAIVIDVRTAGEFSEGHLKNAINIPFEQIAIEINKLNITKDTPIVLYCRSGRRSGTAFNTLVSQKFTNSYNGGGLKTLRQFDIAR